MVFKLIHKSIKYIYKNKFSSISEVSVKLNISLISKKFVNNKKNSLLVTVSLKNTKILENSELKKIKKIFFKNISLKINQSEWSNVDISNWFK